MKTDKRVKVIFKTENNEFKFIAQCRVILEKMKGCDFFKTPSLPYDEVLNNLRMLDEAQRETLTRRIGTVGRRDEKHRIVLKNFHHYQIYVEDLALLEPDYEKAVNLVLASGFGIKAASLFIKPRFSVKQMKTGEIRLMVRSAGTGSIYEWQVSTNSGVAWEGLPPSNSSRIVVKVTKFNRDTLYRYRYTNHSGTSERRFQFFHPL